MIIDETPQQKDVEPIPTESFWKQTPEYPLYAFFLHTRKDQDVAEYLDQNSADLDALTGDKCLIFSFEKPSKWDDDWKAALRERLGPDFDKRFAEWESLTNYTRNEKIRILTDRLGVPMNHLPCMIFAEDLNSRNILEIPFIAKKEYFDAYFKDILTCIQKASESRQGDRLGTMRSEWRQYWLTWIASEKIKEYANAFQEWGTIIANTKDTVIKMIDIISPVFKGISTALKAAS